MKKVIVKRVKDTMKPNFMHYSVYEETEEGERFVDLFSFDPDEDPDHKWNGENQALERAMDLVKFIELGKPKVEETIIYRTGE